MTPTEITQLRESLGLNQVQFGQLLNVHPMTVSKWERGAAFPGDYQLALMQAFKNTAANAEVKGNLKGVLLGAGLVAALMMLLNK